MNGPRLAARCLKATAATAAAIAASAADAEPKRIEVTAGYTSDTLANVSGGRRTGVRQLGLLEFDLDADASFLGVDGASAHATVQLVHGRSFSDELVGDAQVVTNIDAPGAVRPFEAWISLPLKPKLQVKAGLIDLNSEFDVQEVGALFINSSHGIGPDFSQSGLNGPSIFPTTSVAVVGSWDGESISARVGLFDAVSGDPDRPRRTVIRFPGTSGLLLVGETRLRLGEEAHLQLGAWTYTSKFDALRREEEGGSVRERGNRGAYGLVQTRLGSPGGKPLDGWIRLGTAATAFNPIGLYVGGGIAYGAESRRWGLAIAHARLGSPARHLDPAARPERAETIVEFTHSAAVTDRLTVQPDVQYVINPGWEPRLRNALVLGLRLQIRLF